MKTDASGAPGTARRDWGIRLGVAVMAGVITAALGPFSTYELFSFTDRLFYWGGLIFCLVFPAFFVRTLIYRYFSGPPLRQDLIAAGIISVTIGPLVWAFNRYYMGFDVATSLIFVEHIGIVALICVGPVLIRAYLRMSLVELRAETAEFAPQTPIMTEAQTAFLRRLEPDRRGHVRRVSADNHQVDVWTDRGSTKLRLRFSDALEELLAFEGTRIHRSHWVAYNSIKAVVPDGRRHMVHLSCGTHLPVSQNGLRALQEAGLGVEDRSVTSVKSA